jgi:hypothetical protein
MTRRRMGSSSDLIRFHQLKAALLKGVPLSFSERLQYRRGARVQLRLFRRLGDERGVASVKRDLGLLRRDRKREERKDVEVME